MGALATLSTLKVAKRGVKRSILFTPFLHRGKEVERLLDKRDLLNIRPFYPGANHTMASFSTVD